MALGDVLLGASLAENCRGPGRTKGQASRPKIGLIAKLHHCAGRIPQERPDAIKIEARKLNLRSMLQVGVTFNLTETQS